MVAVQFLGILRVELVRLVHRLAPEGEGGAEDNSPGHLLWGSAMPRQSLKLDRRRSLPIRQGRFTLEFSCCALSLGQACRALRP